MPIAVSFGLKNDNCIRIYASHFDCSSVINWNSDHPHEVIRKQIHGNGNVCKLVRVGRGVTILEDTVIMVDKLQFL